MNNKNEKSGGRQAQASYMIIPQIDFLRIFPNKITKVTSLC